jgi:hypothetical protein
MKGAGGMSKALVKIKFLFRLLAHPFDGFYGVRHEGKGSVLLAFIVTALFSLSFSINRVYASFVVNDINPLTVDSLGELRAVFALYILFCAANWSITCLMNGEGRFRDILTAVGYALFPLVLVFIPATIVSQGIAANEEAFYWILIVLGIGWSAVLVTIGIMTIHGYTLGKTLATLILTLISMFLIIFVALMVLNMLNQIIAFVSSIYMELLFRG